LAIPSFSELVISNFGLQSSTRSRNPSSPNSVNSGTLIAPNEHRAEQAQVERQRRLKHEGDAVPRLNAVLHQPMCEARGAGGKSHRNSGPCQFRRHAQYAPPFDPIHPRVG